MLNIKPLGSGRFAGYVCGHPIVRSSRTPFFDAARALIARGSPPAAVMVMAHSNGTQSLRATLAAAAALSVEEADRPPQFRKWKPRPTTGGTDDL